MWHISVQRFGLPSDGKHETVKYVLNATEFGVYTLAHPLFILFPPALSEAFYFFELPSIHQSAGNMALLVMMLTLFVLQSSSLVMT